jgi:hypothetical protein
VIETGNQPPADFTHSESGKSERLFDTRHKVDFMNPACKGIGGGRESAHHIDHYDDASRCPRTFNTFNYPNDHG